MTKSLLLCRPVCYPGLRTNKNIYISPQVFKKHLGELLNGSGVNTGTISSVTTPSSVAGVASGMNKLPNSKSTVSFAEDNESTITGAGSAGSETSSRLFNISKEKRFSTG